MQVVKRDGSIEEFNVDKIINAIKKAFKSCNKKMPQYMYDMIGALFGTLEGDTVGIEEIQNKVEDALMNDKYFDVAKSYIIYREQHKQARFIRERIDYMNEYSQSNENAATSSETDANANVTMKNVANLEGEVYKVLNRTVQRQRMKDELNKLFPNSGLGHQYIKDLRHHIIYQHDESSTPVLKFYCQADSLYPLMTEGVGNIDGVTPTPPNDLESFCGQMRNLVFLLSSQCKGATAYAGYNVALAYYIRTEFGPQWYNKLDVTYTNEHITKQHTIRHRIAKAIKDFIWSINQPAGNRSFNSPFTNISWFDKYYFQAMYEDFYYPDGTKPKWEEIDVLQRMEMQILRELRLITPLTFPVTTISLLYDEKTKEFKDSEYYHLACEEYAKGGSFFTYMNSNPASLASCCRVLNEMENNTFSSTTGMNGEMTGSCNVMTLNLNRIVQDWWNSKEDKEYNIDKIKDLPEGKTLVDCYRLGNKIKSIKSLKEYIVSILERVYKYQIAYKTMLYDMEDKGMFAASNGNYIYMKKLYSTIGVIGYMEAAEFLGLEIGYNENYTNFLEFILSTIRDENKKHSILDKKRPFKFNTEAIPGENLGVKLYNWDKEDGYKVTEGRERYSCYFFNPWDNNISIFDKLKLHGGNIAESIDGGQAAHLNLDAHLSESQYEKLLQYAAQVGCNYFTFNIPMSKCDDCGHAVNAPISKCPKCGSTHITYYTRIIGYLTAVKNWSDPMQKEFTQRIFTDKTIGEIVNSEEQNNPDGEVEPNFHEGNWIVDNCGDVWEVKGIMNQFYLLEGVEGDESIPLAEWVDKTSHLWTIQDAKDGDVLAYDDGSLAIFHYRLSGLDAGLYMSHILLTNKIEIKQTCAVNNAYPATKEQRDTLMKAMTDAGYIFDFEKKELKKI